MSLHEVVGYFLLMLAAGGLIVKLAGPRQDPPSVWFTDFSSRRKS